MITKKRKRHTTEAVFNVQPLTEFVRRGFKTMVVETQEDGLVNLRLKAVKDIEGIIVLLKKPLPIID